VAVVKRSSFLAAAGAAVAPLAAGLAVPALAQRKPDVALTIGLITGEIAPGHTIRTICYNGSIPGPLIRVREGAQVSIDVSNELCGIDEIVHWHGLHVPAIADGAMEEGGPMIMAGGKHTYTFVAKPAGTRWYHTHTMAKTDLNRSLYTGEFGFFFIEPKSDPGRYDQEVFIALRQWEPSWVILQDLRRGPPPDNGLEVNYMSASFNGRALGYGDPVRVRRGQHVLFRLLNANATMDASIALPGHRFTVLAFDGNPVPTPRTLDVLYLAPGERIDAVVEMNNPGIWIFGATQNAMRTMGMGTIVEYAGASGEPVWQAPPVIPWDYTLFARPPHVGEPDGIFHLTFDKIPGGRGGYNRWTINGKSWPDVDPLVVQRGKRYRIVMDNKSGDMHPIHLHRHSFEVTNWTGKPTSGLIKDVVALPGRKSAEIEFVAENPGPSLFHCHMQDHQDFGFMMLVQYA
jgi:FtsP/CotA-like multicopper oxidase with cupredoxin domain